MKKGIRYTELNKRVTFYSENNVTDNHGGWTKTWVEDFSLWAKAEPLMNVRGGYDVMLNEWMQRHPETTHVFTIRFDGDVNYKKRVKYKTITYEILGMENINEEERWIRIYAREVHS